jgi:hypothetical protein
LITNKKPRGTPFQKGHDPRRNLSGGSSPKEKQDLKKELAQILEQEASTLRLRKIVRQLLRKAEQGQPWAISEVLDRGLGKPAQSVGLRDETPLTYRVVYDTGAAKKAPELDAETSALTLPASGADVIDAVPALPEKAGEAGQDGSQATPEGRAAAPATGDKDKSRDAAREINDLLSLPVPRRGISTPPGHISSNRGGFFR